MTIKTKANLYYFGIFFVVYFVIYILLLYIFKDLKTPYVGAISAALTVILAPQKKIIKKQSGDHIQLKWVFSKRVIILK